MDRFDYIKGLPGVSTDWNEWVNVSHGRLSNKGRLSIRDGFYLVEKSGRKMVPVMDGLFLNLETLNICPTGRIS